MKLAANESRIKAIFTAEAHTYAPLDEDTPSAQDIVAAILSEQHSLSTEQLMAFEALLDAPDIDAGSAQELLQTIWNIVVCIIDYKWEQARAFGADRQNDCGSIDDERIQSGTSEADMISLGQSDHQKENKQAAVNEPRQKGRHDDQ